MFAVPFPKPFSFLPPVTLNSRFCLLGLKAWKWLRVARRCQEERAQSGVGTPRSPQGEERSRLPLHLQRDLGCRAGEGSWAGLSMNPKSHPARENSPKQPTGHLALSPAHGTGTRSSGGSSPWPCRGPGPLGSSSSQAHTGSQVRRAGLAASARDVVFSHSPGAGPNGSGTLRGFGSHTGCH